jgi:hypothetical protein
VDFFDLLVGFCSEYFYMSLLFFLLLFNYLIVFLFLFFLLRFVFVEPTSIGGLRQSGHERHVVIVTSRSFEKERYGVSPHSGAYENRPTCIVKNATDLGAPSLLYFACCEKKEDIPHTSNNWVCSDFQQRIIVLPYCTIRSDIDAPAGSHVKS